MSVIIVHNSASHQFFADLHPYVRWWLTCVVWTIEDLDLSRSVRWIRFGPEPLTCTPISDEVDLRCFVRWTAKSEMTCVVLSGESPELVWRAYVSFCRRSTTMWFWQILGIWPQFWPTCRFQRPRKGGIFRIVSIGPIDWAHKNFQLVPPLFWTLNKFNSIFKKG